MKTCEPPRQLFRPHPPRRLLACLLTMKTHIISFRVLYTCTVCMYKRKSYAAQKSLPSVQEARASTMEILFMYNISCMHAVPFESLNLFLCNFHACISLVF